MFLEISDHNDPPQSLEAPALPDFERLCDLTVAGDPDFGWFADSYQVFIGHEMTSGSDLIKLIAFAYSWMPTMAKLKTANVDWDASAEQVRFLSTITTVEELDQRRPLVTDALEGLVLVVNGSVVGLSKVLHFAAPETIPIIDSRVVRAWSRLFGGRFTIGNISYGKIQADIVTFHTYWRYMLLWQAEIHRTLPSITMRQMETKLFLAGKRNLI